VAVIAEHNVIMKQMRCTQRFGRYYNLNVCPQKYASISSIEISIS